MFIYVTLKSSLPLEEMKSLGENQVEVSKFLPLPKYAFAAALDSVNL